MPIAYEFGPNIVIVSAGFDAARGEETLLSNIVNDRFLKRQMMTLGDPIGENDVTPAGFAHMTSLLKNLSGGKLVLALEGGYNINSISKSALACVKVLLGEDPPDLGPISPSKDCIETVHQVTKIQSQYWKCLAPSNIDEGEEITLTIAKAPGKMVINMTEMLRIIRARGLLTKYSMVPLPISDERLATKFYEHVLCSKKMYEKKVLFLFVHEMPDFRADLKAHTNSVNHSRSYMVDSMVYYIENVVQNPDYGIIDVAIPSSTIYQGDSRTRSDLVELLVYLWDNHIQIASADRVVLLGASIGCHCLATLINDREQLVMSKVICSILIPGDCPVPAVTKRPTLTSWYYESLRLRGVQPDSQEAKRKRDEERLKIEQIAQAKRARVKGNVVLKAEDGEGIEDTESFVTYLEGLTKDAVVIKKELTDSDETEEENEIKANHIKHVYKNLKISTDWPSVKVTPERIYCAAVHPNSDKILASCGDKMGWLGFWDANGKAFDEDEELMPVTWKYRFHTRTISSMMYSPTDCNRLFTSAYDGMIRFFDLEKATSVEAHVSDENTLFTCLDTIDGNVIYCSNIGGQLEVKDIREPINLHTVYQLHDRKIGCVSVNPVKNDYLITASLDRTMRLWDLRKLSKDDPQSLKQIIHYGAVTSAYWRPDGKQIVSTSFNDKIRVFDYDESSDELEERLTIQHNNQTGKWVTMFRSTWHPNPNVYPHFVVGNMKRAVDIYSAIDGRALCILHSDELTAIPAVNVFHPTQNIIISGNASGRMVLWK
ncbi:3147_t:CDS:10 [Paraglomus occultum]|uniref:DNA damage-binding protein CMR1 n=1 Tax=Paraglomus occultum TaxID=144539 RepID=A0A9N8ZUT1_9GLOM|nr:3147_t:CDS:10 [Paraglomus occultum]